MIFQYLLKNSDLGSLFRFVSPNFFKVVSPSVLLRIGKELKQNQGDPKNWEKLWTQYSTTLHKADIGIKLDPVAPLPQTQIHLEPHVQELGERLLVLFFHQILTQDIWILDFRAEAVAVDARSHSLWKPKPFYFSISPSFLKGVRSLYQGFYGSDDALFDQALLDLGLSAAKTSLKNHFGRGDQSQVEFKLKTFQNTFTEVFEVCAREKIELQPEFFILGIMLLGLYQQLEILAIPFDARKCFNFASEIAQNRKGMK